MKNSISSFHPWLLVLAIMLSTERPLRATPQEAAVAPFSTQLLPKPADDPAAPHRLRIGRLPKHHLLDRGSLLALYTAGRSAEAVGWSMVAEASATSVIAVIQSLPKEVELSSLRAGPMPERVHIGKVLGAVLRSPEPDAERVQLNLGAGDLVQVGDYYHVLGSAVRDATIGGRSLGREVVGLLKILATESLSATARIEHGVAPQGSYVRFIGHEPPRSEIPDQAPRMVTLLIVQFLGEHGQRFTDRLIDTLQTTLIKGYKQIRVKHETATVASLDSDQSSIKALGRKHGADIVVWGSVLCTDKTACIRPRVTVIERDGAPLGGLAGLVREEPETTVSHDALGNSAEQLDARVLGLASRVAGLALFEEDNYADAAWHFEAALRGAAEDAQAVRPFAVQCYERIGYWERALQISRSMIIVGKERKENPAEALGHLWTALMLARTGENDEALTEAEQAARTYRALGENFIREVAWSVGKIADIYQARGQLDEALRIRNEDCLPVYKKLGDIRSRAVTMGKIADIYQARGQLDEALRIRNEEELPVYKKLGDIRSRAVTMGKIADIYQARGQLDEALRIRNEDCLPVYKKLSAKRDILVCQANMAIILRKRNRPGDWAEAQQLLMLAQTEAIAMRLPEAAIIARLLQEAPRVPVVAPQSAQ